MKLSLSKIFSSIVQILLKNASHSFEKLILDCNRGHIKALGVKFHQDKNDQMKNDNDNDDV